ncbi:hypothetical protein CkaCkLH20_10528 [Colletotrichum karsti]|uniref:DUF8035 domain-containing protein n=1 Tax=Colletotrichum karsti TaxID=1095194 RepID=A0A9P6I0R8_9PEZI|nr:uncharacterized protein CkaCkLH20_10528 [Colletotrichum karsti]KAF9871896.1 hypothetical protein CkaCkLH20_10528 [Colletotrichum karsti]
MAHEPKQIRFEEDGFEDWSDSPASSPTPSVNSFHRGSRPERGTTRIPAGIVSRRALIELGYPFAEDGDTIIVQLALKPDLIEELLRLSEHIRDFGQGSSENGDAWEPERQSRERSFNWINVDAPAPESPDPRMNGDEQGEDDLESTLDEEELDDIDGPVVYSGVLTLENTKDFTDNIMNNTSGEMMAWNQRNSSLIGGAVTQLYSAHAAEFYMDRAGNEKITLVCPNDDGFGMADPSLVRMRWLHVQTQSLNMETLKDFLRHAIQLAVKSQIRWNVTDYVLVDEAGMLITADTWLNLLAEGVIEDYVFGLRDKNAVNRTPNEEFRALSAKLLTSSSRSSLGSGRYSRRSSFRSEFRGSELNMQMVVRPEMWEYGTGPPEDFDGVAEDDEEYCDENNSNTDNNNANDSGNEDDNVSGNGDGDDGEDADENMFERADELHKLVTSVTSLNGSLNHSDSRPHLPSSLVEAFERIIRLFVLKSKEFSWMNRFALRTDLTHGAHAEKRLEHLKRAAETTAEQIRGLLNRAKDDIMLLGTSKGDMNRIIIAPIGPEFLVASLISNLQNNMFFRGSDKRLDLISHYRNHTARLRFDTNRRPKREAFVKIHALEEELEALQLVAASQQGLWRAYQKLFSPLTFRYPTTDWFYYKERKSMFKLESKCGSGDMSYEIDKKRGIFVSTRADPSEYYEAFDEDDSKPTSDDYKHQKKWTDANEKIQVFENDSLMTERIALVVSDLRFTSLHAKAHPKWFSFSYGKERTQMPSIWTGDLHLWRPHYGDEYKMSNVFWSTAPTKRFLVFPMVDHSEPQTSRGHFETTSKSVILGVVEST